MKKLILAKISCIAVLLLSNAQLGKSYVYYQWTFNNTGLGYVNPGWSQTTGPNFVTVGGNTSSSAAGMGLGTFNALNQPVTPIRLVITARLGPNHTAGMPVRLAIGDLNNGMGWDITSQLNNSSFTTIIVTLGVNTLYNNNPNLAALTYFQVEGDYNTTGTFELEIQSMAIIPEPHQVAVASLLLLGLGAVVVRRKLASRNNPVLA